MPNASIIVFINLRTLIAGPGAGGTTQVFLCKRPTVVVWQALRKTQKYVENLDRQMWISPPSAALWGNILEMTVPVLFKDLMIRSKRHN